jgi:hypothetical protein
MASFLDLDDFLIFHKQSYDWTLTLYMEILIRLYSLTKNMEPIVRAFVNLRSRIWHITFRLLKLGYGWDGTSFVIFKLGMLDENRVNGCLCKFHFHDLLSITPLWRQTQYQDRFMAQPRIKMRFVSLQMDALQNLLEDIHPCLQDVACMIPSLSNSRILSSIQKPVTSFDDPSPLNHEPSSFWDP